MIATATSPEGRPTLIVGLEDDDVAELRDDRPIRKHLDELDGLPAMDLVVLGPEDVVRFYSRYGPTA